MDSTQRTFHSWHLSCFVPQIAAYHIKLSLGLIRRTIRTARHLLQLILYEVAAQWGKVVGEGLSLDMVILVLDDTSRLARELLVMLHEVLVKILHVYT